MKIFVKAKPSAKIDKVEKINDDNYIVSVKEPPIQGRANAAIVKILAEYFEADARIVSGWSSRNKIVEIGKINKESVE